MSCASRRRVERGEAHYTCSLIAGGAITLYRVYPFTHVMKKCTISPNEHVRHFDFDTCIDIYFADISPRYRTGFIALEFSRFFRRLNLVIVLWLLCVLNLQCDALRKHTILSMILCPRTRDLRM